MKFLGKDPLIVLLESKRIEVEMIPKGAKLRMLRQWRKVFARQILEDTNKSVIDNRDLEIFRRSLIPYSIDEEAEAEYLKVPDTDCVILSSDNSPGLSISNKPPFDLQKFCVEGARPWGLGVAGGGRTHSESEILVFPHDYAWTLAIDESNSFFALKP